MLTLKTSNLFKNSGTKGINLPIITPKAIHIRTNSVKYVSKKLICLLV